VLWQVADNDANEVIFRFLEQFVALPHVIVLFFFFFFFSEALNESLRFT